MLFHSGLLYFVVVSVLSGSEGQSGAITKYCSSSPCQHGGTCQERIDGFVCDCRTGYTGIRCDIFDYCESSPCLHSGRCIATQTSYICDCTGTGYDGFTCHVAHDDCQPNPCLHSGTCVDGLHNYTCQCVPGFAGEKCEIELSACVSNPCQNGGTCYDVPAGSNPGQISPTFQCQCIEGIEGVFCESNYDDCSENECQHGLCVDHINDYTCDCTGSGYSGDFCEQQEVNLCSDQPCRNGATCVPDYEAHGYHCECLPFHEGHITHGGKNCSVLLRGCENVYACNNGAVCVPVLLNEAQNIHDFTCKCQPGYEGRYCDTVTAMTISGGSYIRKTYQSGFRLSLRFRTADQDGVIMYDRSGEEFVSVEMVNGSLYLVSGNLSGIQATQEALTSSSLADSYWHSLVLDVGTNISLTLDDVLCNTTDDCTLTIQSPQSTSYFKEFFIGQVTIASWLQETVSRRGITGCVEDVMFNSDPVIPSNFGIAEFHNTKMDCPACLPNSCKDQKQCVSSTKKLFECRCASQTLDGRCIAFPGVSCDFNKDMCGWKDGPGSYNWRRYSGSTGSQDTGPDRDHTTVNVYGYYIYTEASGNYNRDFILNSPRFSVTDAACLSIWVHLHGVNIGSLKVFQVINGRKHKLISVSGEHGTQWKNHKATLQPATNCYLQILGHTGSSFQSDIGVDDIQLTTGAC